MKRTAWIAVVFALLLTVLPGRGAAAELNVAGKSALLMEISTGKVLYEKNAHEQLAPASVTKVMTMLLIMEAIDSGKIQWEEPVIASEAAAAKGGSQVYLKVGEQMSVTDMLRSVAVSSANDCACALAEHISGSEEAFVSQMNARAAELGMEDTHFVNCTGLDDGEEAKQKHRTSAYDIALMSRELMKHHPKIREFTTIWMATIRNGAFGLSNTNRMVRFYQGATGLKTGFTDGAGFCLAATAQRQDMELVAVVMGADTSKERFAVCKSMLDYGFANYALAAPELPRGQTVPVRLGVRKQVTAELGGEENLLVEKAQRSGITQEICLEESVDAPVSRGQRLGMLTMRSGEQILAEIPLVAGEGIPKLSWWNVCCVVMRRICMAQQRMEP